MDLWSHGWARIANDVVHDLSAGAWPGTVLGMWLLRGGVLAAASPDYYALVLKAWSNVFVILLGSLLLLLATGTGRLAYRGYAVKPALLASKGRTALIKHGAFVTVMVLATIAAFLMLRP